MTVDKWSSLPGTERLNYLSTITEFVYSTMQPKENDCNCNRAAMMFRQFFELFRYSEYECLKIPTRMGAFCGQPHYYVEYTSSDCRHIFDPTVCQFFDFKKNKNVANVVKNQITDSNVYCTAAAAQYYDSYKHSHLDLRQYYNTL